jgi:N-acetyl sugar amidotransferase
MPNTKPGVMFDREGVCSACRSNEAKRGIDFGERAEELKELAGQVRGSNGNGYECIVPVSGGKDSMYQTWMMAKVHGLKTLAVCMAPHVPTEEGVANLNTLVQSLNVDLIKVTVRPEPFRDIRRKCFLGRGEPNWAEHLIIFSGVARIAMMYRVPLIVWGEDIAAEFGGTGGGKRVASAESIASNDLIKDAKLASLYDDRINESNTYFYQHPDTSDMKQRGVRSIYLGYYDWWDGYKNFLKSRELGFKPRKAGPLSGNLVDYDNIDEKLCEINIWFKFLKFGFWRPTDQACYRIWNGAMTRTEAVKLVNQKQYEFPIEYLHEFLEFHKVTEDEFWETVDRYRNRDIWERTKGEWRLKTPLV